MALLGSGVWSRTGVISSPMGEDEDVFELPMSQRRTPRLFKAALSTFISNASSRVNLSADASSGPRSCGALAVSQDAWSPPGFPPCSDQAYSLLFTEQKEEKERSGERRGGASFASCSIPVRAMGPDPVLPNPRGFPRTTCPSWSHIADLASAPLTPSFLLSSGRKADAAAEW